MRSCLTLAAVLALTCSAAWAQPVINMDGVADDVLYEANGNIITQDTETGYGDASTGRYDVCNGSELDTVYAAVYDDGFEKWLYIVFAGNFETNGNKLNVFFDTVTGGQNMLVFENPGPVGSEHWRRMCESAVDAEDGLKFSAGFEADYWIAAGCFGDPPSMFVDYAELYVDAGNPGQYYYVGAGADRCLTVDGDIVDGTNPEGMRGTFDNSNTAGVPAGEGSTLDPAIADVMTGIELAIPFSMIGDPTGNIGVTAFISNSSWSHLSNQLLGGLFGSPNLQDPRGLDLSTTWHLSFTVPGTPVERGACCVGTTCTITTPGACGGTYLGDNTDCVGNPCDTIPTGGCFMYDDPAYTGTCEVLSEADCVIAGGAYQGDDTDCRDFICTLPRTGACCFEIDPCDILSEADCIAAGGEYAGDFTDCGACVTTPAVTGDMNGWTPNQDLMTETAPGSGIWERSYTGFDAGQELEFKITFGSTYDGAVPPDNSWLVADPDGDITITYDSNTYADGWVPESDRINLDHDPGMWVAIGVWQGWDNDSTVTAMVPQGGGIYTYEQTFEPGTYTWRPVMSGSWHGIGTEGRSVDGDNQEFTTDTTNNAARMWVDAFTGVIKVETFPGAGPVLGACCLIDGSCQVLVEDDCLAIADAVFLGEGTECRDCYTPVISGTMNAWDRTTDVMTESSPGVWEYTYTELDPSTRHEFKIAYGATDQGLDYPANANSWLFTDVDGDVTITFNTNVVEDGWSPNVDRIGLSTDPGTWTAAGDFQGWDNGNAATMMVDQGGGIYLYETTGFDPGDYLWKAVVTGSWDSISWNERSVNTANMTFTVTDETDTIKLWVNSFTGVVKVEVEPAGQDWCMGDMDCSGGAPDFVDILFFAAAVGNEQGWRDYYDAQVGGEPPCPWLLGDYGGGPGVEFSDIVPFANSVGQPCVLYVP